MVADRILYAHQPLCDCFVEKCVGLYLLSFFTSFSVDLSLEWHLRSSEIDRMIRMPIGRRACLDAPSCAYRCQTLLGNEKRPTEHARSFFTGIGLSAHSPSSSGFSGAWKLDTPRITSVELHGSWAL